MTTPQIIWHGTQDESFALLNALAKNCTCEFGLMGVRLSVCAPHKAMSEDQRWLDHLIYERRYWAIHHGETEGP